MPSHPPTYVITGVANDASIAWGVADRLLSRGYHCLLAVFPKNVRRAEKLVTRAGYEHATVVPLDVSDDQGMEQLTAAVRTYDRRLAGVLHSIAYAETEALQGPTSATSRSDFLTSMNLSVYSLLALVRCVRPALGHGSSIVALSYYGGQRCVPGYNVMGIGKAALESACRYLAYELGADGIRVNCASPGMLLTLSSAPFADFQDNLDRAAAASPLKSPTRMEHVSETICYLLSDGAAGITGQVVYVDNGLSIMGA